MSSLALIWDLDGTLLDSYGVISSSLQEALAEFQVHKDLTDIRHMAKEGSVSAVIKLTAAETGLPAQRIKDRYLEISGARVLEIPLMPHSREILEGTAALGCVHFVYTHRGKTAEPVLEHLGLQGYFREIVTSINGFPRKPSPDALFYLMEKHRLEKGQVFYVGDRSLDMECAKNAGVRGILYSPSGTGTADYVVRDLMEIKAIAAE